MPQGRVPGESVDFLPSWVPSRILLQFIALLRRDRADMLYVDGVGLLLEIAGERRGRVELQSSFRTVQS